jgi:hypothetical protein
MCSIIDKDKLELQTIYFCDTSNSYNLIDKKFNTIIYNKDNVLTYYIDEKYNIIEIIKHTILKDYIQSKFENHLLYDDLIKKDGTEFNNNYFSLFSINFYNITINNIITNMFTYENNTYTYKFIDNLFINNSEIRDNFNIVNICIFTNKLKLLLDYINIESKSNSELHILESKGIFDKYVKYVNFKNTYTEFILGELVNKIREEDIIDMSMKDIFLEIQYFLKKHIPRSIKSKSYFILQNCISSIQDQDQDISYGYKSAINFSNYRNFIKSLQKTNDLSNEKTSKFKQKLYDDYSSDNLNLCKLYFYVDLIIFKHSILLSNIETKVLNMNFYNVIIGSYINKILQKGTQSRLFPISLTSVMNDLTYNNDIDQEYVKIREKYKHYLSIIDTYTMIINDEKIAGCGESCVYNYINKLLFDGEKIDVNKFPENLKDTDIYKFYEKYFKNKSLTEQNIAIQSERIFNEFAILLMYHDNVSYIRKNIEFLPTEENFIELFSTIFKIKKSDNMIEMSKEIYEIFNNTYENIEIDRNYLIIDTYRFLMTDYHCRTMTQSGDIVADLYKNKLLSNKYISLHYFLNDYVYEIGMFENLYINTDDMNIDNYIIYKFIFTQEDFKYFLLENYYKDLRDYHSNHIMTEEEIKFLNGNYLSTKDVKYCGLYLKYRKNQTYDMCLKAVKEYPNSIKYVKDKKYELILEAIRKDPSVIRFINQTYELCLETLKRTINIIHLIKPEFLTIKLFLEVFETNPDIIKYIKHEQQTYNMCLKAIKYNGDLIKYIKPEFMTEEICLESIKHNPMNLEHIPHEYQTFNLCVEAMKNEYSIQLMNPKFNINEIYSEADKRGYLNQDSFYYSEYYKN